MFRRRLAEEPRGRLPSRELVSCLAAEPSVIEERLPCDIIMVWTVDNQITRALMILPLPVIRSGTHT